MKMMNERILEMLAKLLEGQDEIAARVAMLEGNIVGSHEEKLWFSPEELAEKLNRKPYTCREWARRGRVRAEKVDYSNKWRIHRDEVKRLTAGGGLLPDRDENPSGLDCPR
jgi:excisionase family DNA binding protein